MQNDSFDEEEIDNLISDESFEQVGDNRDVQKAVSNSEVHTPPAQTATTVNNAITATTATTLNNAATTNNPIHIPTPVGTQNPIPVGRIPTPSISHHSSQRTASRHASKQSRRESQKPKHSGSQHSQHSGSSYSSQFSPSFSQLTFPQFSPSQSQSQQVTQPMPPQNQVSQHQSQNVSQNSLSFSQFPNGQNVDTDHNVYYDSDDSIDEMQQVEILKNRTVDTTNPQVAQLEREIEDLMSEKFSINDAVSSGMTCAEMKPDQIKNRLGLTAKIIQPFIMHGAQVKSAFYNIMAFVQKMYKENLPYNDAITISENAIGKLDTDTRSVENAKLIDLFTLLVGPPPTNTSSTYTRSGMVDIDGVIKVGVSPSVQSKLFYCLLNQNTAFSRNNFISYVNSTEVTENGCHLMYTLKKYMDRPYLRTVLKGYGYDEITTELYCFILENIHMFKVDPMYIIKTDKYVILDLYSLVSNVKYFYKQNGELLDYNILGSVLADKYKTLVHNYLLPDIAINTKLGPVNNSKTFSYAFWLYEKNYLALTYYDNTWFKNYVDGPTTNMDSNLSALCTYQIFPIGVRGKTNVMTIDADVPLSFTENANVSCSIKKTGDLDAYYKRSSDDNKKAIDSILRFLADTVVRVYNKEEVTMDLFCIYPLLFYSITNDDAIITAFLEGIHARSDEMQLRALSVSSLPVYTRPKQVVKAASTVVTVKPSELYAQSVKERQILEQSMKNARPKTKAAKKQVVVFQNPMEIEVHYFTKADIVKTDKTKCKTKGANGKVYVSGPSDLAKANANRVVTYAKPIKRENFRPKIEEVSRKIEVILSAAKDLGNDVSDIEASYTNVKNSKYSDSRKYSELEKIYNNLKSMFSMTNKK